MVVALGMPVGCATNKPEMAWVGTDGRRIGDDADLLKQGHTDIAVCNANLDAGVVDQGGEIVMIFAAPTTRMANTISARSKLTAS